MDRKDGSARQAPLQWTEVGQAEEGHTSTTPQCLSPMTGRTTCRGVKFGSVSKHDNGMVSKGFKQDRRIRVAARLAHLCKKKHLEAVTRQPIYSRPFRNGSTRYGVFTPN